ncbi:hypothetical protein TFLX_03709 [Thermoflexales bacterium]|nr:hypothetical protein TFLX_03709 [Thermoflexales bacterium]
MKLYRLMFLLAVATILLACQSAAPGTPESRASIATNTPASGGSGTATSVDEWQRFSSTEGGFSILLPARPKEQRQPVNTAAGSVEAIMYIAEVKGTAFGAGYSDFPTSALEADSQAVLEGARDGAAKNINGTVLDEKPIELAGYPGLEIVIEMPAGAAVPGGAMYRAQLYLVGQRLYQVIYVALKADENPAEYQKLFDSFHLDNPPTPSSSSSTSAAGLSLKDWIEYRSAEGGFTVLLPAEPEVKTQSADTAAGTVQLTMAMAEAKNYAAGVSFNEIPSKASGDPETLLAGGREGAAKNLKGIVVSNKPIKLGAYPGTEFVVKTPSDLIYTARLYLVDDRLYQILFLVPKEQLDQFDVQGFFDSFTLLEK